MAEYRRVEYRIGKDGKITETVVNGAGASCTDLTTGIEQALGQVEDQKLLPEYYAEGDDDSQSETLRNAQG